MLATIKRDLRRVKRDVQALQPAYPRDLRDPLAEEPELGWDTEQAEA